MSRTAEQKRHRNLLEAEYREKNRDRLREYQRQWQAKRRASDPEYFKSYHKAYHEKRKGDARIRAKQFVVSIKQRVKAQDLGFDLDQYIPELTERISRWSCELSGIRLDQGANRTAINSVSLDRIDSSKGYLYSNMRVVAWGLNAAFAHWGEEETARLMRRWLDIRDLA